MLNSILFYGGWVVILAVGGYLAFGTHSSESK